MISNVRINHLNNPVGFDMQTVDVMYDIMGIYKDFETRIIVYKGLNSEQIYFLDFHAKERFKA